MDKEYFTIQNFIIQLEQLDYLNGKDKLTKYEVDRANALLQIEIKRLALENTRANKSKLRLRRDSQGNYTYQYVEDADETKKVLYQSTYNVEYSDILYHTGDLAYYNEYGELMYKGRKDFQIKHLGHRIELGEIEVAASSVEGIKENCCIFDEENNKIVLLYTGNASVESVETILKGVLPGYMIPSIHINIDTMPYNANGKIDRQKIKDDYCFKRNI